ncbi:hypothetical protein BpHYR1_005462 [Brachionus plicatilis]|uniref:Uncharacterized protein n=1 Tax=Brachionus plicatilis TaxID=10195 RepID=A0A3M7S2U9_BRAPC|nr:hypothetical protein BpHYR1_005462 [Brachionus plicatilis]
MYCRYEYQFPIAHFVHISRFNNFTHFAYFVAYIFYRSKFIIFFIKYFLLDHNSIGVVGEFRQSFNSKSTAHTQSSHDFDLKKKQRMYQLLQFTDPSILLNFKNLAYY